MAEHHHDRILPEEDARNPYASDNRWRHQESSAFARAAVARDPVTSSADTQDLTNFLNSTRIESDRPPTNGTGSYKPIVIGGSDGAVDGHVGAEDGKEVVCGPLLNYRRMDDNVWHGSVLIVTRGGGKTQRFQPTLHIGRVEQANHQPGLLHEGPGVNGAEASLSNGASAIQSDHGADVVGTCLYSDPRNTFWSFPIACDIANTETKWAYSISEVRYNSQTQPRTSYFFIPASNESMRIMFHSCNGFSVGTDEEAWSGPALWNDVMRSHAQAPFHVMLGGGDQIYNDGIRVDGPLREWTNIGNPKKRRGYPFTEKLRADCDDYYLKNYIRWYSTEPFASANGQIAQMNIWDDHDIIDGFGSYVHEFMKCDVFRGIGGTAHKYYMLFQHHLAPPASTYTSDAPQTFKHGPDQDENQLVDTFVKEQGPYDPSYIIGHRPGPYVAEHSLNMFSKLGARIAFVGLDARTERTRHQVNYPETYDIIFERLQKELRAAASAGQPFRHLILLLGIPIAYPRLTWLENVFSSPLIAPIKFLNRRFGFGGGVFNHFDGSVDLLDDLDDHYTARTHKKERNTLVERLQTICSEFSVRLTILGGDVHLAALGRFYSNPNLHIPAEADHRYMVNVVSSAIVNKPPPNAIANLLASRNKIHHLDADTDETLMNLFDKDPGESNRTRNSNHVTMPSRNYAILTENSPNNHAVANGHAEPNGTSAENTFDGRDGHSFLHHGEDGAGIKHKAASSESHGKSNDGSLDCCIRVEVDQHDKDGKTEPYGLTIPVLNYQPDKFGSNMTHRLGLRHHRSRPDTRASRASTAAPPSVAASAPEQGR
ncbi:Uu.00g011160.m01.CDS01 [Anthostomella pinea]|uniref:Uu.00g011160.m01.CDS01 n=1 Tax=Anthostomella pinea TaxID=933095 RepID=A0AAI8VXP9_9PEZI|nr:Uu.00g011160.m01.CDS01 [Anthostomella pinea]